MLTIMLMAYNQGNIIKKTIDSFVSQNNKEFKLLISDDLSTDDTFLILKEYESKYDFIKVIQTKEKKKVGNNRNNLLKNVSTEYCCFVDGDDPQNEDFVEKIINFLGSKKDVYKMNKFTHQFDNHSEIYSSKGINAFWLFVVRTEFYKSKTVNPYINAGEDVEFFIRYYDDFHLDVNLIEVNYIVNRKRENSSITAKMDKLDHFNIAFETYELVKDIEFTNTKTAPLINLRKIHLINYAIIAGVEAPKLKVITKGIDKKYKFSYLLYIILPRKLYRKIIIKVLKKE